MMLSAGPGLRLYLVEGDAGTFALHVTCWRGRRFRGPTRRPQRFASQRPADGPACARCKRRR